jgi:hypothetical protein
MSFIYLLFIVFLYIFLRLALALQKLLQFQIKHNMKMKKTGHRVLFIHTWPKLLIISCKKGWTNWVNLGFQILEHKIHKHTSKRGIKKMPCIYISTNLNLDGIDTDPIFSEVTTAISTIIGRPEKVIYSFPSPFHFLCFCLWDFFHLSESFVGLIQIMGVNYFSS